MGAGQIFYQMVNPPFTTHQAKGKGRGRLLGFPTINMQIPADFDLPEGIYAVWVNIGKKKWMGAMHYGPVPVFGQETTSLEVFLLDAAEKDFSNVDTSVIGVTPVKRLRDVCAFPGPDELIVQIRQDVEDVRQILTS